tara:strand:- start:202 stop:549 length:348 start_codon:yes stop_codon:yes gene_type:complete
VKSQNSKITPKKLSKIYTRWVAMTSRMWEVYASVAPLIFIAMAGMLLAFDLSTWTSILYSAITIGLTTVIMWWFWAIWSIRTIGESMEDAHKTIEQVRKELKLARKEMKEMPFDR